MSYRITFGHSERGDLQELIVETSSIQITYEYLRDESDNTLAVYTDGLWKRSDTGTFWTDVSIAAERWLSSSSQTSARTCGTPTSSSSARSASRSCE